MIKKSSEFAAKCNHCKSPFPYFKDLNEALRRARKVKGDVVFVVLASPDLQRINMEREWAQRCLPVLIERYGHKCLSCHRAVKLLVDHIVPLKRGGTSDIENLSSAALSWVQL